MDNQAGGVFVQNSGIDMNVTTIRGVQYIVFSFFDGDQFVDDRIGDLIQASFKECKVEDITSESLVEEHIHGEDLSFLFE